MRTLKSERLQRIEDACAIVNPDALAIDLSDSRRGRPRARLQQSSKPLSFQYISWMLFLFFWIIIARVLVPFYMTTHTITTTKGVSLRGATFLVGVSEVEDLISGVAVRDATGLVLLDPSAHPIRQLRVSATGEMTLDEAPWPPSHRRGVCVDLARAGEGSPIVLVYPEEDATYQSVVWAIDSIEGVWADSAECSGQIVLVSRHLLDR